MTEYSEFMCPDGYVSTKVPLGSVRFLNRAAVEALAVGEESERYARYCDLTNNGHAPNGVPVVYRTPSGAIIASDLRYSELAFLARINAKFPPEIDQHVGNPYVSVKIVEIRNAADIPAQRAKFLEDRS